LELKRSQLETKGTGPLSVSKTKKGITTSAEFRLKDKPKGENTLHGWVNGSPAGFHVREIL
jgi:hypothetical protein